MRSDYFGQHLRKCQSIIAILLIATILTVTGSPTTAQGDAKTYNSIIRKLEYITAAKAYRQLLTLGLGTDINKIDKTNSLIITTDNFDDKIKVTSILNLIDSKLEYEITKLASNVNTKEMPARAVINAAVKGIEIGTFAEPPMTDDPATAIVDIHGKDLVSIAPKGLIKPIISGLANLKFQEKKPENTNTTDILRLSETTRSTATTGKTDETFVPAEITVSPRMKQLKEAQIQLAEAFKNAQADSVNEFMKDKEKASQITMLANNVQLDTALHDVINETYDKAKIKTADSSKESTALIVKHEKAEHINAESKKTEPEKTIPKPTPPTAARPKPTPPAASRPKPTLPEKTVPASRRRVTGAIPPRPKPVTTEAPKTEGEAPAPEIKPAKITATPKKPATIPVPPKKEMEADDIMKMIEALNKQKSDPTNKPVNTNPVKIVPKNVPETKPALPTTPPDNKVTTPPKTTDELLEGDIVTTISLPTKVQIAKLLELVGMQLGLNYMYEPKDVADEVTLFIHDGGRIKVSELYSLVESVLKFKGLVMTRKGKLVIVVKQGQAMDIEPKIIGENDNVEEIGDVIVIKVFKLKHISTEIAQQMLTEMKMGISVQSIPENSKMIITDYAYRMKRIQEVLDLVDIKGEVKVFRDRTLKYLTPSELAPKLQVLANELGTLSISLSSKTAAAPSPTPAPTSSKSSSAAARTKALAEARARAARAAAAKKTSASTIGTLTAKDVYLDIDDRTNRVLMIGVAETVDIVEDLINTLDVPQQGINIIRLYPIEFVDASMIIDILSELGVTATGARPVTPTSSRSSRAPTPSRSTSTRGASSTEGPMISLLLDTNALLVNATKEKHEEIMAVIKHIDVENPDEKTTREYEIEHVDTQEILDTLMELGITSGQTNRQSSSRYGYPSSSRSPTRPTGTRTPTTPTATAATQIDSSFSEPLADEPKIAVLETTNSLLVHASAKQHASIEMVLKHVDREIQGNKTPYIIYPLENQDPEELKPILDELVNATIEAKTANKPTTGTGSTARPSTTSRIISTQKNSGGRDEDERITIVSDPATYSLVVYASKKNQLWIGGLIDELDAYRPQVLLDVTLVEVSKNDEFSYDVNLLSSIPNLATASTSGLTGALSGDITAQSLVDRLMNSGQKSFSDYQANGGNFTGFYGNTKMSALFHAMEKKNYGRILAKPKLLVDDNQEGTIETKNTVYITRLTTSSQSVNNGDPIQTQNTEFDPYDARISLAIKPHISKGENLRLEITLSRSDFVELDKGSPVPPEQATSDITTVATVPNNHTIILGGMDRINQSKGGTRVPILGSLPLIGGLFRSTGNSSSQKKLYVFVKAHILRPGELLEGNKDIVNISRKFRKEFEEYESQMQKYEDWPGIKPQPMDPLQILEDDEYIDSMETETRKISKKSYTEIQL